MADQSSTSGLPKPARVLIGVLLMALVVGGCLLYLTRRAGEWGIPYFSFTTPGGSTCTNQWAGYTCEDVTDADFAEWAKLALPERTRLVEAKYTRTHNYQLRAVLRTEADPAVVDAAWRKIAQRFGRCQDIGVPPMEFVDYTDVCLINSRLGPPETSGVPAGENWTVSTAIAPDGTRLTIIDLASR
ncbi:MAG: hypothetical protein L0G99_03990 [Propionibacteriales bacterium]|nr:hypothetical protein [Propionibacteriales bacterium]